MPNFNSIINALLSIAIFCISQLTLFAWQVASNFAVEYVSKKIEGSQRKFPKSRSVHRINLPATETQSAGVRIYDFGDAVYSVRHI